MADHPTDSTKVSCAHCGATFLIQEKNRSKVSCPKCKEPLTVTHSGILKRVGKRSRKTSQASIDAVRKAENISRKTNSTFVGAPMGFERELAETSVNLPQSAPKAFKEALAMSRMEMDLGSDAFSDPPLITGSFDEPTMAIESEVDDKTKPPPGMRVNEVYKGKESDVDQTVEHPLSAIKIDGEFIVAAPTEPITFPLNISDIGAKAAKLGLKDGEENLEAVPAVPEKPAFRRAMKTSELANLLKKAKKKKRPPQKAQLGILSLQKSATKPIIKVPKTIKHFVPAPKEDSLLIQLQELDKKLAPPGLASENRGSGFIKLPTTDILDVLGKGQFRLRVEGIIYEPVDKYGLTQLIKGGVLLGAEDIAEAGGDWMPISKHPVFGELRKRMAAEAHALLAKVTGSVDRSTFQGEDSAEGQETEILDNLSGVLEEGRKTQQETHSDIILNDDRPTAPPLTEDSDTSFEDVDLVSDSSVLRSLEEPDAQTKREPEVQKTMQMFAMKREKLPEDILPTQNLPSSLDDTIDVALVEISEIQDEAPKKKSPVGLFLAIFLIAGLLIAGVIYADSLGYLDSLKGVQATPTTPDKKEKPKEKPPIEKAQKNTLDKIQEVKKEGVEAKKKDGKKTTIVKENSPSEKITGLDGMAFISKASGKAKALIFEKEKNRFILIPETEPKGLDKILAAQKMCELLHCPFNQNKVNVITIDGGDLKEWDPRFTSAKGQKVRAFIQPISKESFSIANVNKWRSTLGSTKNAKKGDHTFDKTKVSNLHFARQLSGVLLRDYLVNDWNRFERKPSHLGVDKDGLVDQVSNVAFGLRASGRVKGRFSWTAVFPSEMVEELRKLKKETTLELLFPNASAKDKSRFNVFWKQRNSALKRIDALIAESGKGNVLLDK